MDPSKLWAGVRGIGLTSSPWLTDRELQEHVFTGVFTGYTAQHLTYALFWSLRCFVKAGSKQKGIRRGGRKKMGTKEGRIGTIKTPISVGGQRDTGRWPNQVVTKALWEG